MRYALIQDGIVVSAIELAQNWDQPDAGRDAWQPPEGHDVVASEDAGSGWTWDGKNFTPPPAGPDVDPKAPPHGRNIAAELDMLKEQVAAINAKTAATAVAVGG